MFVINLGDGHAVTIKAYVAAVKLSKQNPDQMFDRSLRGPWPATGREIVQEFREDLLADMCNRGLQLGRTREREWYLARRMRHGRLTRVCRGCGQTFVPSHPESWYCWGFCVPLSHSL